MAAQKLAEQQRATAQTQTTIAKQQRQTAITAKAIAEKAQINADVNFQSVAAQNLLTSNLELESLVAAIKTGQHVKQLEQSKSKILQPDTRMRAIAALRQVVYGVQERDRLEGHNGIVGSVSFSPDGQTLATASDDGTVILWNLNLDDLLAKGCAWIYDYLQNNPNVSKEDKHLCDGVRPPAAQSVQQQSMEMWWWWRLWESGWRVEGGGSLSGEHCSSYSIRPC